MRSRSFTLLVLLWLGGACGGDAMPALPDAAPPPLTDGSTPPADRCQTANGGCATEATCVDRGDPDVTCACPSGYEGDGIACTALALCDAPEPASGDVGAACAPLTDELVSASTTCGSQYCLADGQDPAGGYCTRACDPSQPHACPSGFACAATGAPGSSGLPGAACERIEQLAASTSSCFAPPSGATPSMPPWHASFAGRAYLGVVYGQSSFIYIRPAGHDTWDAGGPGPFGDRSNLVELSRLVLDPDTMIVTFNHGAVRLALDSIFYQVMEDLQGPPQAVFRTATGAIRAIAPGLDGTSEVLERVADQSWTHLGAASRPVVAAAALEDHGVIAVCGDQLCVSEDGVTMTPVLLPTGESIGPLVTTSKPRFAGRSPAAFFVLSTSGAVLRCDATACTRDVLPIASQPSASGERWETTGFIRSGDETYLHLGHAGNGAPQTSTLRLDGTCWQRVNAPELSPVSWGGSDGAIHYATPGFLGDLCAAAAR